ncbi:MAG TPA: dipeptidyl carboxypeptidase II, partial [Rhodanobacteraceae bacterium]|nr:dipeptidyl carboxypeptidase II [Rhodanobacteraceae bacterium]
MRKYPFSLALNAGLSSLLLAACGAAPSESASTPSAASSTASTAVVASNALLKASTLPFEYPPFDQIKDADFGPAMDQGMAEQLAEIKAIAENPAPASFDNTIVAMEQSGRILDRATTVFFNLVGADTNKARQALQAEYSPKLAAHRDAIYLNPALFQRVDALYQQRAALQLDAESQRLLERYHTDFVRAGAKLDAAEQARMKAINAELASLGTKFSQNVLAEVNDSA